jgi:hypothetical protein
MQLLFTFIGGNGHFLPLLPLARAAVAAGHTVVFGCNPSLVATVAAAGFTAFPLGTGDGKSGPAERLPLRPVDMVREEQEFRDRFARDDPAFPLPPTAFSFRPPPAAETENPVAGRWPESSIRLRPHPPACGRPSLASWPIPVTGRPPNRSRLNSMPCPVRCPRSACCSNWP